MAAKNPRRLVPGTSAVSRALPEGSRFMIRVI